MPSPQDELLRRFWDSLSPLPEGAFRVKDRRANTLHPRRTLRLEPLLSR
jgi:hypothetical protein